MSVVDASQIVGGIEVDLDDGEFVQDVLVIASITSVDGNGMPRLYMGASPGMSYLTQRGLIATAEDTCRGLLEEDE